MDELINFTKDGDLYRFNIPVKLMAQENGGAPKFKGVAYSGGTVKQHMFFNKLIMDVSTMSFKEVIPIFRDHESKQIVGDAKLSVQGFQLEIDGRVLKTQHSEEILSLAEQGFNWELSIGAKPEFIEEFRENQSVTVNGQTLSDVSVFRNVRVVETSFVAIGADENTSVNVFKKEIENKDLKTNKGNEMELQALQEKFDKLTVEFACACEEKKNQASKLSELEKSVEEKDAKIKELESEINKKEFSAIATDAGLEATEDEIAEFASKMDVETFKKMAGKIQVGFKGSAKKDIDPSMTKQDDTDKQEQSTKNFSQGDEDEITKKARSIVAESNGTIDFQKAVGQVVAGQWTL